MRALTEWNNEAGARLIRRLWTMRPGGAGEAGGAVVGEAG